MLQNSASEKMSAMSVTVRGHVRFREAKATQKTSSTTPWVE